MELGQWVEVGFILPVIGGKRLQQHFHVVAVDRAGELPDLVDIADIAVGLPGEIVQFGQVSRG